MGFHAGKLCLKGCLKGSKWTCETCPGRGCTRSSSDWDQDALPDLVVGGEDGFLYYLKNPHAKTTTPNGNAGQDE